LEFHAIKTFKTDGTCNHLIASCNRLIITILPTILSNARLLMLHEGPRLRSVWEGSLSFYCSWKQPATAVMSRSIIAFPWFSNCASQCPMRIFDFLRASHKNILAVLFNELKTVKFCAVL